jgi:hypothetical protein
MVSSVEVQENAGYRQTLRKALREVVALFVSSFRLEGEEKNSGFLPFSPYPSSFRRRFSKRSD